jgi:hypothetical protein
VAVAVAELTLVLVLALVQTVALVAYLFTIKI